MCTTDTLVHPIDDEDNAIALIRFESGATGQFEVSWTFRGGMDLRDEVAGTHGTIWLNHFLRTGFEMFTAGGSSGYVAEKAETAAGWLFPVGDEVSELGYVDMFSDMFNAIDGGGTPQETLYDGYVVNAIMDACYRSAKNGLGAGRARLARRVDPADRGEGRAVRGQHRDQARGPPRRPGEADPQGPLGRLRRSGDRGRVSAADAFELRVIPASEWAVVVADAFLERLRARPGLRVCLPTGDTPGPLYAELAARDARSPDGAYAQATVVLLDEWLGLPPGDAARCDVRLRRELLDRLAPPPRFVGIDVDASDDGLAALAHDRAARGLDLALLGLGMNGHVGFNEPGSRPDDPTRVVRLARSTRQAAMARYGAVQAPTGGITVGLARLLEAEAGMAARDGRAQGVGAATGAPVARGSRLSRLVPAPPSPPDGVRRRGGRKRAVGVRPRRAAESAA